MYALKRAIVIACLLVGLPTAVALDSRDHSVGAGAAEAKSPRPNVIVFMTDDQTVSDMAVMPRTRRLFERDGVSFRNSFVSYPVCCPSRATFFSGQYAHNHRVLGLYPPTGGYGRFDKRENLPVWLERAGYRTAHIGKYMNGYGSEVKANVPPGWSDWYGAVDSSTYRMWGYTLDENGKLKTYGSPFDEDPRLYQTDVYRDKAIELIRRNSARGTPFFLSLSFLAPHHETGAIRARVGQSVRPAPRHRGRFRDRPLLRPRGFDEPDVSDKPRFIRRHPLIGAAQRARMRSNYRARLESLLAVDEAVEAVVDELRRTGELENTYLLFTSDNGFMYGEHRVPGGKMLPYDPSTRVPLLIRGPGLKRGAVSQELVANVDLAPTILDIAGARAGKTVDGRSLIPFARRPGRRTRRPLLLETGGRRFANREDLDAGPLQVMKRVRTFKAVRTGRYLYVEWRNGERELYDLAKDPAQLHSRHADPRYARVRAALARVLHRLLRCKGAECRKPPSRRIPTPTS